MAKRKKILFLGETYRADAITWMNGLKEFGDFEIVTWELKTPNHSFFNRSFRILEYCTGLFQIKKLIKLQQPDMVIAERTTSYGFLAALSGVKPVAIAQQGRTDLWPEKSFLLPLKKIIQNYAFEKADLIHAWGPVMTVSMRVANVDMKKVLVLPKGIDLKQFKNTKNTSSEKLRAIVTRSLMPEYRHDVILKAFWILKQRGIDFELTIVGDGKLLPQLRELATKMNIENKVNFTGQIPNTKIPELLQQANFYISMPITEGVSASLFEAMASNCYPIVTDIPGNQSWIKHRENGQLIPIDDTEMLANELLWAFENKDYQIAAVLKNRKFVEDNANYITNMKIIATKYHELINTLKNN
ncbi:glycosyltransferase family 4 protein [Flavobacterium franklandianum]|uniref:glycosyltransferase family 4 protein n=1 Tax=Flavobacterium franklandianum TaxID=2594430 RepID=UPI00117B7FD6|nr:glycosyltransferase family 4 protein [Flavobacterium franklandianum]TRX26740.1 glycosyltransferase family 4 protein [Flavobacterium franklandianum]